MEEKRPSGGETPSRKRALLRLLTGVAAGAAIGLAYSFVSRALGST
jgi:hypothetical protein